MFRDIVRKLFAVNTFFTIAIRHRDGNIIERNSFVAENTIFATRQEWYADPFLAEEKGRTFLFYEKVHGDLGSIEVAEIMPDCSLSTPTVLFDGVHYSYPYVFKKDDRWYMIPESSANNEVTLFGAIQFPYCWEKVKVLLQMPAVDTTVFQMDGIWYLLSFLPEHGCERVTPMIYKMHSLHVESMRWDEYDSLCVRGAGCPFIYDEKLIRPVQVSTNKRYGDNIVFVMMSASEKEYFEKELGRLTPENVKARGQFYDGLHTYNASEHFEVIDIRCHELSWKKPFIKLIKGEQFKLYRQDKTL